MTVGFILEEIIVTNLSIRVCCINCSFTVNMLTRTLCAHNGAVFTNIHSEAVKNKNRLSLTLNANTAVSINVCHQNCRCGRICHSIVNLCNCIAFLCYTSKELGILIKGNLLTCFIGTTIFCVPYKLIAFLSCIGV